MKFKRVFLIVLDSLGVGEAIDADAYDDKGANTLGSLIEKTDLFIPNLEKIGLLNTINMTNKESEAYYTIARPKNKGKDTLSGHYELMGVENIISYKTFNNQGFPRELLEKIALTIKKPLIGNIVAPSYEIINKLAPKHFQTGALIIYTTADSNLEVAAHEDVVPVQTLYNYCEVIREITKREEWKVGRVIARPFKTVNNEYVLTNDTRSYTLLPSNKSVLDILKEHNYQVISIGKVNDVFNGCGITKIIKSFSNEEGINKLSEIMDKNFEGLCFLNLSDLDTLYGHSRDLEGYKKSLEEFDVVLPMILNKLNIDDLLIITADHGCDPSFKGFNHTRENVPVIVYSRSFIEPKQIEILDTLADVGATILDNFELDKPWFGKSFKEKLK